jgi:hypothetical protein
LGKVSQRVADDNFALVPIRGRHDVQGNDARAAIPGDLTCQVERVLGGVCKVRWVQQGFDL